MSNAYFTVKDKTTGKLYRFCGNAMTEETETSGGTGDSGSTDVDVASQVWFAKTVVGDGGNTITVDWGRIQIITQISICCLDYNAVRDYNNNGIISATINRTDSDKNLCWTYSGGIMQTSIPTTAKVTDGYDDAFINIETVSCGPIVTSNCTDGLIFVSGVKYLVLGMY